MIEVSWFQDCKVHGGNGNGLLLLLHVVPSKKAFFTHSFEDSSDAPMDELDDALMNIEND